jgi:matrixin
MRLFWKSPGGVPSPARRTRLFLEQLESRLVPAAVSGNVWPHPELITLSFMPDGTLVSSGVNGPIYSDLFAKMNARWSTQTWENAIVAAAQTWAQYANINFTVVGDNGTASGQGLYQQGDPGMGDIRFGAYALGAGYLGMGDMPPPINNYSIAGDINFNDTANYNIGTTYDLQTVAMHEVGHALGLGHSTTPGSVMYPYYSGTKRTLTSDDVAGIQAIYGARAPDVYNQGTSNNSFATVTNVTSQIDPSSLTFQAPRLDITAPGAAEYFTLTAPAGSGALELSVQSSGLSLLRPAVTVYAADQLTVLGSASGAGSYNGSTLTVSVATVNPSDTLYIKVAGADSTAFGTGEYALTLGTGTAYLPGGGSGSGAMLSTSTTSSGGQGQPLPPAPLPSTQTLDGAVLSGGGGLALTATDALMVGGWLGAGQWDQLGQWLRGSTWQSVRKTLQNVGQSEGQLKQADQWVKNGQWDQLGQWLENGVWQQVQLGIAMGKAHNGNGQAAMDAYTINALVPHPPGCGCNLCRGAGAKQQTVQQTTPSDLLRVLQPPSADVGGAAGGGTQGAPVPNPVWVGLGVPAQGATGGTPSAGVGADAWASGGTAAGDALFTDWAGQEPFLKGWA